MRTVALQPLVIVVMLLAAPALAAETNGASQTAGANNLARSASLNTGDTAADAALLDSATNALRLALERARELEYETAKHVVVLTQKDEGGWEIYFKPRPGPKPRLGGGLTVHVDEDGLVSQVQRWR